MEKEKIQAEMKKLFGAEEICNLALVELYKNNPKYSELVTKEEINILLSRIVFGEVDFLAQNPETYFGIYVDKNGIWK